MKKLIKQINTLQSILLLCAVDSPIRLKIKQDIQYYQEQLKKGGSVLTDKITLKKLEDYGFNLNSLQRLLKSLDTKDMSTQVSVIDILDSNGVRDAFWALRCWDYEDYCLVLAEVLDTIGYLHNVAKKTAQVIRSYYAGNATEKDLKLFKNCNSYAFTATDTIIDWSICWAATWAICLKDDTAINTAKGIAAADRTGCRQWIINEEVLRGYYKKILRGDCG